MGYFLRRCWLVDQKQIDVAVDTQLLSAVTSKSDDGDGDGAAHGLVVAKEAAQHDLVHQRDDAIEPFGVFDKEVLALGLLEDLRQTLLVLLDIGLEEFGEFEIASSSLENIFDF